MGLGLRLGTRSLNAATALFKVSGYKPRPDGFLLPTMGMNFLATAIPGVQVPQYLLGHKCLEEIPLVPCYATLGCKHRRENPSVKRPDRPVAPE